jgi:hypothetical protein
MHPWTKRRIEALRELAAESEMDDTDIELVEGNIEDVVTETPRTQLAAWRISRVLGRVGLAVAGMFRDVLVDVASETAKKVLFNTS